MSHPRRHPKNFKRQAAVDPNSNPDIGGLVSGAISVAPTSPTQASLQLDPGAPTGAVGNAPPLASNNPTITTPGAAPSAQSTPSPSTTPSASAEVASASSKSQLPIGTVVAACVGALVGAILLVSIFLWWCKRPVSKSRSVNTRGRIEQRQTRGRSWNRLGDHDEDRWEGAVAPVKLEMKETQRDSDEKNFPMFKKSPSMRTTRTAKALEEHGIDLPPFEFAQYHPTLAEELSLEHPDKPFATRQNSGSTSWDRETVGDDSFLSLRSVRVDSGTMSPTIAYKMTPPATANGLTIHKWESAEVVHMEGETSSESNPFEDGSSYDRGSRVSNPFFGAQEIHRTARSRSNSRGSRHSRNTSRTSRTSRYNSRPSSRVRPDSEANPFSDATIPHTPHDEPMPMPAGIPVFRTHHAPNDSIASNGSGGPLATEQAMKNLIAALDLTQEEVEERLRVASMQGSMASRYSGASLSATDAEDDITVRGFPAPISPLSPHAR